MKSKTKKVYETPQLTVVSFKMERGYASSGIEPEHTFLLGLISSSENSDRALESRTEAGYWGGGDENSWF